ncbi:hypothetical protein KHU50_006409 [Colletotrichum sp. SAR 10_65]|nr:hypothetical protein KHU50_006409 [Colletotrichum sp. SAR 10_65]KAJ5000331.1 hypothetical protein K4K48_002780 [Colletotrichum sp. SAR 10_66]
MDPRYSSSRYTGTRPRSPTYNPARASMPTSIGYSSIPTRDDYRSSDSTFYTQPASSIRSRSHHRGGSYSATMDNEEFTRLRERTVDGRLDAYRPTRSSTLYANSSRHGNAPIDYGATDGYEYTAPGDLARYDLDHSRPPSRTRRRESIDRGYYRPSVNVTTTDPVSRPYNDTGRRGGPPPTTWGLDKINKSTTNVYDSGQGSIPPIVPAAPVHMQVPPSPRDRRSAGIPSSLDVAAPSVAAATVAGPTSSRRPVSVYNEGTAPRSIHHEDYYRSREDDRVQRQAREDRPYDATYGSGDYFHDDAVSTRGFGIRTDSAPLGGDFDDPRNPRREVRPESRNGYRPESRTGYRPESRTGHRTSPPDTKRGSDDESRKKRDSARLEPERERHSRRISTANDDESERTRFRDKVSAGLGLAATAIGLGQAVKEKDEKPERSDKPEKESRESRRRNDEDESGTRTADRYKPRDESRNPRDRAPVIVETRRAPADSEADTRERDRGERERERERDRDRDRRDAEARLTGDSVPSSQRDGSPDDDLKKSKRPAPKAIGFNPTNTNDIRELKEQLAAMRDEKPREREKVPIAAERSDRSERPERSERYDERYDRSERSERSERLPRDDRSDQQTYADLPLRDTKERTPSPRKESPPKRESPVTVPSTESTRDESRGREVTPPHGDEKQVRVVSPPRDKSDSKPLKGILKAPSKFPEEDNPIREGVAPHKDDKKLKEVPPGARWTKISRKIVNPEALTVGKERFEVRDDFVIVLRVLSKEEIQAYAAATQVLRERRREEAGKDRDHDRERDRERDRDHDRGRDRDEDDDRRRHYRHHRRDDGDDDRYDEERDRERHRRHRRDDDDDDYHHRRHHRDRDRDQAAIEG